MSDTQRIRLVVNGSEHECDIPPRRLLVDVLRHDLGLHGTHVGCEQGVCGMCTILLDGEPVKSCLLLAVQADGHDVTTVESLAQGEMLHPVQEAFRQEHGLQCGYCTPAFLLMALALKERDVRPSPKELREELAGTLCRCTGYQNILAAVERFLADGATTASGGSSREVR